MKLGLDHIDLAIAQRQGNDDARPLATNHVHRAALLLNTGGPYAAIDSADQALALAPGIRSAQLTRRLTASHARLTSTWDRRVTADFTERVRAANG